MSHQPAYFVAVFGGACSGSETAYQLAQRGIQVAVFEQQALPYGKIEDGLPKWHVKLRNKEENKINTKLSHPNIHYVPRTRLGRDIDFEDVVRNWGFSAVLLASGAWRDRPLPVEGIDKFIGKGFYYQNPLVDWFNHNHEPGYARNNYDVCDGAIVVGGGLASIDVVKILMLETTVRALEERKGIKTDILTLEHKGIPKALEKFGVSFGELGLQGCTLYYRRRSMDMPLGPMPDDPSPEKIAKMQEVRQRILANAQRDYLFQFQQCSKPVDTIVDNGHLAGLKFRRTEIVEGRVKDIPGSEFEARAPLTISSIGSIPEPIPGIPSRGELFVIENLETGKLTGFPGVFALGNAVTGRGNIRESELHGRKVVHYIMDDFLKWSEADAQALAGGMTISDQELQKRNLLNSDRIEGLLNRIRSAQAKSGYDGNFDAWVSKHLPPRLEDMLEGY